MVVVGLVNEFLFKSLLGQLCVASVVAVSAKKKEIRIIGMFFNSHTISFSNISGVAMKFTANVLLPGTCWIHSFVAIEY